MKDRIKRDWRFATWTALAVAAAAVMAGLLVGVGAQGEAAEPAGRLAAFAMLAAVICLAMALAAVMAGTVLTLHPPTRPVGWQLLASATLLMIVAVAGIALVVAPA